METDGSLSVIPYDRFAPITPDVLGVSVSEKKLPTAVISDGRVLSANLKSLGLNEKWLFSQLRKKGIKNPAEVFLMTADTDRNATIIKREAEK